MMHQNPFKYFFIFGFLFNASCAKFDLSVFDFGSTVPAELGVELIHPPTNYRFVANEDDLARGTCDPEGGDVTLTGNVLTGNATGPCSPEGEFSIPIRVVSTGSGLEITARQTNVVGNPHEDDSINLGIHCVASRASELTWCTISGTGTSKADPYMVPDIECLQEMRDGLRCHYALANDIDASATRGLTWLSDRGGDGKGFEPVPLRTDLDHSSPMFYGSLNGNNFTIYDLFITQRTPYGTGIFSWINDEFNLPTEIYFQVFDLNIVRAEVIASEFAGIIAGFSKFSDHKNISVRDSKVDVSNFDGVDTPIDHSFLGLMFGEVNNTRLEDIFVSNSEISLNPRNIDQVSKVGGLIGKKTSGSMYNIDVKLNFASNAGGVFDSVGGVIGEAIAYPSLDLVKFDIDMNISTLLTAEPISIQKVGGVVGSVPDGLNLTHMCNILNVELEGGSAAITDVGAVLGQALGVQIDVSSTKGSFSVITDGSGVERVGGYIGGARDIWSINKSISNLDIVIGRNALTSPMYMNRVGSLMGSLDMSPGHNQTYVLTNGFFGSLTTGLDTLADDVGSLVGGIYGGGNIIFGNTYFADDQVLPNKPVSGTGETWSSYSLVMENLSALQSRPNNLYQSWFGQPMEYFGRHTLPSLPYLIMCE